MGKDGQRLAPAAYLPYPEYNSDDWLAHWQGDYVYCEGPRGLAYNQTVDDLPMAYMGKPAGYPDPDVGSWEALGLHENVCFDRDGRLGPFGLNGDNSNEHDTTRSQVDWSQVRWGKLQDECMLRNKARYDDSTVPNRLPGKEEVPQKRDTASTAGHKRQVSAPADAHRTHKKRTAILIRTWDSYEYRENDLQAIRSLIAEVSLLSGGEYHVFLLVNVKDKKLPIYSDGEAYQKVLRDHVPEEFRDMAVLWTEQVCQEWYPKVGEWDVYWQQFMPLQWFSQTHPEFEYVWNWEIDARLIGQHYHFMAQADDFALRQPRKHLWERNARFYLPAVHGKKYTDYFDDTNRIIQDAKAAGMHTVWGPEPWSAEQAILGPAPPTSEEADDYQWGVGEEADFITLLPLWDPRETLWSYRDKLFNYPLGEGSHDERPYPHVPRRVFINTLARFSKQLLNAMHTENKAGLSMASELWPGSVALQHGLKAVYAPHPIWMAQLWPSDYMDAVFNADGWGAGGMPGGNTDDGRGRAYSRELELAGQPQQGSGPNSEGALGRWSQERDSPYSPDREHNFGGWSWYFWSDFPKVIYWRWLGWRASFNIVTIKGTKVTDELGDVGGGEVSFVSLLLFSPAMLEATLWRLQRAYD